MHQLALLMVFARAQIIVSATLTIQVLNAIFQSVLLCLALMLMFAAATELVLLLIIVVVMWDTWVQSVNCLCVTERIALTLLLVLEEEYVPIQKIVSVAHFIRVTDAKLRHVLVLTGMTVQYVLETDSVLTSICAIATKDILDQTVILQCAMVLQHLTHQYVTTD